MDNAFDELKRAIAIAEQTRRAADTHANAMADLVLASLRRVSPYKLKALKKSLRDFNIHTGNWS
jgi:hypothetical protein